MRRCAPDFSPRFERWAAAITAGAEVAGARFDGFSQVEVELAGGETLSAEIVFAAFGRVANLDGIGLDRLQLAVSSRGHVAGRRALRDQHPAESMPPAMPSGRRRWPARPRIRAGGRRSPPWACAARGHEPGADRRLHDSGDRLRRPVAGAGGGEEARHRGRAAPISAKWRARTSRASPRVSWRCFASAARRACSASRRSARAPPNSSTWARRPSRRRDRRLLRRADLQFPDHDRGLSDRRVRRPEAARPPRMPAAARRGMRGRRGATPRCCATDCGSGCRRTRCT